MILHARPLELRAEKKCLADNTGIRASGGVPLRQSSAHSNAIRVTVAKSFLEARGIRKGIAAYLQL